MPITLTTTGSHPTPALTPTAPASGADAAWTDHEVVELQLLLPRWQAAALDAAARQRGMTSGQILRRVITDLFAEAPPRPAVG